MFFGTQSTFTTKPRFAIPGTGVRQCACVGKPTAQGDGGVVCYPRNSDDAPWELQVDLREDVLVRIEMEGGWFEWAGWVVR